MAYALPLLAPMQRAIWPWLALVLGCVFATGCAPASTYRNSAFVPAARPLSWDGRTAEGGRLRLEVAADMGAVKPNDSPKHHDRAL